MATPFSKVFTRLRKEAGFDTAYRFFHANGGAKVFQCTFSNYLRIEKGQTLPHPRRLPLLSSLLRLPLAPADNLALALGYLQTWAGSEDAADWFTRALRAGGGPRSAPDPGTQALHAAVRRSARPVTMEQYRAIIKDRSSYWCYRALAGCDRAFTPAELSKVLGFPLKEVSRGLEGLRKAGFAKRAKGGAYFCPDAGMLHLFPDPAVLPPGLIERPLGFNKEMARRKGRALMVRHCGIRVDLDRFEGFLPFFRDAVRAAQAYAPSESAARTGLIFVEGRIYKALDL